MVLEPELSMRPAPHLDAPPLEPRSPLHLHPVLPAGLGAEGGIFVVLAVGGDVGVTAVESQALGGGGEVAAENRGCELCGGEVGGLEVRERDRKEGKGELGVDLGAGQAEDGGAGEGELADAAAFQVEEDDAVEAQLVEPLGQAQQDGPAVDQGGAQAQPDPLVLSAEGAFDVEGTAGIRSRIRLRRAQRFADLLRKGRRGIGEEDPEAGRLGRHGLGPELAAVDHAAGFEGAVRAGAQETQAAALGLGLTGTATAVGAHHQDRVPHLGQGLDVPGPVAGRHGQDDLRAQRAVLHLEGVELLLHLVVGDQDQVRVRQPLEA